MIHGIIGLGLIGGALSAGASKEQMKARLAQVSKEHERLLEVVRTLIWADKPDAYYSDWSPAQQDAYDAKADAELKRVKARRDELEEEMIDLDHAIRRKR